jgi:hypothetical protein
VHEAADGVDLAQSLGELAGLDALLGAVGLGVPLRGRDVVETDERGLAALRQPHVAGLEAQVDTLAQRIDALPLQRASSRLDRLHKGTDQASARRGAQRARHSRALRQTLRRAGAGPTCPGLILVDTSIGDDHPQRGL